MQFVVRSSLQYSTVGNSGKKDQYLTNKSIAFITKQTVDGKSIQFEVGPDGTKAFIEHSKDSSLSIPKEFSNIKNTKQLETVLDAHYMSLSSVNGLEFNVRGQGGMKHAVVMALLASTATPAGRLPSEENIQNTPYFQHIIPAIREINQNGINTETVRSGTVLNCGAVGSVASIAQEDKAIAGLQLVGVSRQLARNVGACGAVTSLYASCGVVGDGASAYGASSADAHAAGATASGASAVGAAAYGASAKGAAAYGSSACGAEACGAVACGAAAGVAVCGAAACAAVVGFCGVVGCVALPIGGNW